MLMNERKPRQQSFTSWIDQQIADAEDRGVFDNLPGAGKPLNIKPTGDGDFGQAWMRDYARREGVSPGEFLPTPLKLRREIEELAETVGEMRSETEVRETFGDLNRRILEWRRIPVGPPIHVRLVNIDDMVARWRAARAAKAVQAPAPGAQAAPQAAARPARRQSWLRRLRRRPPSAQLATNRQMR
jgi:DnaJ homologue, subfamily C, member 28, conserved domain